MNTNVDMAEGTLAEGGGEGRPRFPASRQNRETGKHGLARRVSLPTPKRTAMGEYIPLPGGRRLSSYGEPSPSPAHYRPNTARTLPKSPRHSMHGQLYPLRRPQSPSPCDYDTSEDAAWSDDYKRIGLTQKDVTWPYAVRKDAHVTCTPGAGHYLVQCGDTGSARKRSMSARHREGIHAGYPNALVQPVDTLGFKTPGSTLRPDSVRGPSYYIGTKLKKSEGETLGPGPAGYSLPTPYSPVPVFGERPSIDWDPEYPAPNEYSVPDSIGTTTTKTFGMKTSPLEGMKTPAPNCYTVRRPTTAIPHDLTYRAFPTPVEPRPSPAEYTPTSADLLHEPKYSCKETCTPVFPDILLYPEFDQMETPGPGNYEYDREFKDNDNPAYHIGLPLPLKPNTNPSPNRYRVHHGASSAYRRVPSYSIGRRTIETGNEPFRSPKPGPASYNPRPSSAVAAPMTPRRTPLKQSPTPAPNIYEVERGMTSRGRYTGPSTTMKGRPTPALYSGFPSSHLARLSSCS